MKNSFLASLLLTTLAGCNQQKSTNTNATDANATASTASEPQCYALMMNGDTVRLSLTRTGNDVTGDLLYQLAGKDRNTGSITGHMKGDTLMAAYRFQSEGVESVREVAFLAKNGGFVEGYGPVQEQSDRMQFTPNQPLTFDTNHVLTNTPCAN